MMPSKVTLQLFVVTAVKIAAVLQERASSEEPIRLEFNHRVKYSYLTGCYFVTEDMTIQIHFYVPSDKLAWLVLLSWIGQGKEGL